MVFSLDRRAFFFAEKSFFTKWNVSSLAHDSCGNIDLCCWMCSPLIHVCGNAWEIILKDDFFIFLQKNSITKTVRHFNVYLTLLVFLGYDRGWESLLLIRDNHHQKVLRPKITP
jgi:hypothetical protein